MSGPPPSLQTAYASPPVTLILTVLLLLFFFVGFFSIFFCRCFFESLVGSRDQRQSPSANQTGAARADDSLDPSLVQAFPTFVYSTIKDFRREKCGLECAICLAEFEDESVLRLLTVCYHVFHQECIDLWLASHKTCPVCRGNLDLPLSKLSEMEMPPLVAVPGDGTMGSVRENEEASFPGAVSIDIKDGEEEEYRGGSSDPVVVTIQEHCKAEKFLRSHSTGHSIARNRLDEDKYTLKLQDHVRVQINRGHTGSCITFGEFSDHEDMTSNGGFDHVPGHSMHRQRE